MNDNDTQPPTANQKTEAASDGATCPSLERFANLLEMPVEDVREAARNIARERAKKKHAALMETLKIIRSGNTAIMPTGEIVARGTPGSMNYNSSTNTPRTRATD